MPSSTINCQIKVARAEYSVRYSYIPPCNLSDVLCYLPTNRFSCFSVSKINLLGIQSSERSCIIHCFDHSTVNCICPGVLETISNTIKCQIQIYSVTNFQVVPLSIGGISGSTVSCCLPVYQYSEVQSILSSTSTERDSRVCIMPIAASTSVYKIGVDVGYRTSTLRKALIYGEAYTTALCSIVTNTKISDRVSYLHRAVDAELFSIRPSVLYRVAGKPVDYVTLEVVLGRREISTIRCIAEIPPPNYSDRLCSLSNVVSGEPRWNMFYSGNNIVVRFINLGSIKVSEGLLQDSNTSTKAESIEHNESMAQMVFKRPEKKIDFVVVASFSNGKVLVVDQMKGSFTL